MVQFLSLLLNVALSLPLLGLEEYSFNNNNNNSNNNITNMSNNKGGAMTIHERIKFELENE